MTSTLRNQTLIGASVLVAAMLFLSAGLAQASEVTGTLTAGASATSSTDGSLTGTVSGGTGGSGDASTPNNTGGGGGHRSGGGGGTLLPTSGSGEVLGASTVADGVGGGGDYPGVPNAGEGGDAVIDVILLILAAFFVGAGAYILARKKTTI